MKNKKHGKNPPTVKRGRGRPKKYFENTGQVEKSLQQQIQNPITKFDIKKKTDSVEPVLEKENSPKGIITEGDLLEKVESVKATGEQLPDENKTTIEPGTGLETELINSGQETTGVAAETEASAEAQGDVIAEMENNMILSPLEVGLDLQKGFLTISKDEQKLLAMVRPDDLEIKKSPEAYWTVLGLLNVSKFIKWFVWNWRRKKEEKKKAEQKKKEIPIEKIKNAA